MTPSACLHVPCAPCRMLVKSLNAYVTLCGGESAAGSTPGAHTQPWTQLWDDRVWEVSQAAQAYDTDNIATARLCFWIRLSVHVCGCVCNCASTHVYTCVWCRRWRVTWRKTCTTGVSERRKRRDATHPVPYPHCGHPWRCSS